MLVGAFSAIVKSSFEALVQSDNGDPRAELGTLIIHADICHHNTQEHFRSVDIFTNKWLCLYPTSTSMVASGLQIIFLTLSIWSRFPRSSSDYFNLSPCQIPGCSGDSMTVPSGGTSAAPLRPDMVSDCGHWRGDHVPVCPTPPTLPALALALVLQKVPSEGS